jgi:hypothetical protein
MSQKKKNQKPRDEHANLVNYFDNLRKAQPSSPRCEKVLGYTHKVGEFGAFWREHAGDIDLLVSYKLMDFAKSQNFTTEEYAAYRLGLGELPAFLDECFREATSQKQKKLDDM